MKTWSKVQEAGPSPFRLHFDLSWTNHEGSDLFLYHQKVVNNWENRYGLPPSGDVKNVTSNVLPEAPVDETTFRGKHYNQRKSKFTIFKSVKTLQNHWFVFTFCAFLPYKVGPPVSSVVMSYLQVRSLLQQSSEMNTIDLVCFFSSVSHLLLGLILTGLERISLTGVEQLLDEYSRVSSSKQSSFKNTCNVAKLLD